MNIKFVFCLFSFLFIIGNAWSQVTIGNGNVPAKGALLDMKETESSTGGATSTKGVVFPRVSLDSLTSLTPLLSATDAADAALKTTHKGAVVYNVKVDAAHNLEEGFYYWDAAKWIKMTRSTSVVGNNEWLVSGNGGTNPANNFVGTTDAQPLAFRVNNLRAGFIGNNDTINSFGLNALKSNTVGNHNNAFGYNALTANTRGGGNSAFGNAALSQNINGSGNTALGDETLFSSTGDNNTAVGWSAGTQLISGSNNIAIGANTQLPSTTANNQMNIGNALFGTRMNGTSTAPAGNIGVLVNNPQRPLHVKTNNSGTLTPARIEGLPQMTDGQAGNPLVIDANGDIYRGNSTSAGQVLRYSIAGTGTNSRNQQSPYPDYDATERALRLEGNMGKAPNGANNVLQTMSNSLVTSGATLSAGVGAPARTTDRILLETGVYRITLRLTGAFTTAAVDNTLFIKMIIDNKEFSLTNNAANTNEVTTFVYDEFIVIPTNSSGGTIQQYVDFTVQTKTGTQNKFQVTERSSPDGNVNWSLRSVIIINRLR